MLPLEIAIYECDSNVIVVIEVVLNATVLVGVILEVGLEIVDNNRCYECLPRSGNAGTE